MNVRKGSPHADTLKADIAFFLSLHLKHHKTRYNWNLRQVEAANHQWCHWTDPKCTVYPIRLKAVNSPLLNPETTESKHKIRCQRLRSVFIYTPNLTHYSLLHSLLGEDVPREQKILASAKTKEKTCQMFNPVTQLIINIRFEQFIYSISLHISLHYKITIIYYL